MSQAASATIMPPPIMNDRSRSRDDGPPPTTMIGLAYWVINKFGTSILSLIYLVVISAMAVLVYERVKPDWTELRAISENAKRTAEAQVLVSGSMSEGLRIMHDKQIRVDETLQRLEASVNNLRSSIEKRETR